MENQFTTYDILLTAFLLTSKKVSLIHIREAFPHKFVFVLTNSILCEQLSKDYLNYAVAPARELFSNREMLISEIKRKEVMV